MISVYGVSREWRKVAPGRVIAAAALAAGLTGCSMSIPGFIDRQPTASIRPKTYPFAAEDWAVVEPVLRASLRAEEDADPATWVNPDSGRRGEVLGVGGAFTREGAVCRTFTARIEENGASRRMQATGCESRDKPLAISDVAPFKGI